MPAGSGAGSKLRLKGRGLPGTTAGDFFVVLQIVVPPADSAAAKELYAKMAQQFKGFDPRASWGCDGMAKNETLPELIGVILEEQTQLTLAEISRGCAVHAECIIELVEEGVLAPTGREPRAWRFTGASVAARERGTSVAARSWDQSGRALRSRWSCSMS